MLKFKNIIFFVALFASQIYFCFEAIFGNNLLGAEEAPASYKYYCIICFVLFFLVYFFESPKIGLTGRMLMSYFIIGIYVFASFVSGYWNVKSGLCLIAFCLPASCLGIYYARTKSYVSLMKYIDLFIPFMAISLVYMLFDMVSVAIDGIKQYSQSISNMASLCYLFTLFILAFGDTYDRFKPFTSKWYRYFYYFLLPFLLFVIFFSGGRGGFVIVFIGTFLYFLVTKHSIKKLLLGLILIGGVLYVGSLFLPNILGDDLGNMLTLNFERVFSYISSSGIDMSETSNRDDVFVTALACIDNSPIIGYGLYGYLDVFGYYPHNIVLEILLQGGYLFLFVAILVAISLFVKFLYIQRKDKATHVLLPFIIYPFVQLLYTGSYMENPFFWFSVMFIFNYNIRTKRESISDRL